MVAAHPQGTSGTGCAAAIAWMSVSIGPLVVVDVLDPRAVPTRQGRGDPRAPPGDGQDR